MAFRATETSPSSGSRSPGAPAFPMFGPLAMTVIDEFADVAGQLRVSLLGIPLHTQTGAETNVGEAMRYLAELAWAPQAIAANRELQWRAIDDRTVEVDFAVADLGATVRWEFNAAGDLVRATNIRPFPAREEVHAQTLGRRLR
jgi:hypothetical protein